MNTARDSSAARLARVFGDVLAETASDERDSDERVDDRGDDWLKSQIPPHHDS